MEQIVATAVFAVALVLIFSDWLHRTIVALAGAVVMVIVGRLMGFYDEEQALAAIDFTTIGLLLGMMIVVSLLVPTGFFEYIALQAGRWSGGRPLALFLLLGGVTSVLSMFLDNVTTVVVIAPVTLVIAQTLHLHPAPLLMSQAMLANIAGIATLVGDPPNILIASAAGLSFNDFLTHSLPVLIFTWSAAAALLWLLFRGQLKEAVGRLAEQSAGDELHPREALLDRRTALKVLIVLLGAVVLFFLQELLHISPAFVAIGAAAVALLVVRPDIATTLERVEWSVLMFFTALFVMVGGLEHSGALEVLANALGSAFGDLPPMLLGLVIIWVVAALSAIVDNIPITIALIPVIAGLEASGIEIGPLWWALAFGAGLGGNATIIGSTANVVVVSVADRTDQPISSRQWMRYGIPVMLVTTTVTSVFYVLLYPLIER